MGVLRYEAYIAAAVSMAFLCGVSIAVALAFFRKGVGKVFLSYHHSNYSQVREFARHLQLAGFEPLFVEFTSAPEHDALLDEIYVKIGLCDFFVCFPGMEPSFVEAEVSAAIAVKKPMFIILPERNRGRQIQPKRAIPRSILKGCELSDLDQSWLS